MGCYILIIMSISTIQMFIISILPFPCLATTFVQKIMKIIIEDGICTYVSDFTKKDEIKGGMLEEYYPEISECMEEFVHLLSCYRGTEAVKEYLKDNNISI